MVRKILLVAVLSGFSISAWAQETVSSALPDGYPDPQCVKPEMKLVVPESGNIAAVYAYNAKIKTFNKQAVAYDACMHGYIDKANQDVKIIQEKANADLKQISERANASMKAIQDKIGRAVADATSVAATLNQDAAKLRNR
jgi:hypothetical protein